ncbi:zinc ribbon domain-containing protein [Labilibaculum sp. K2S]|uniref:zinc ribbon domain-containing protein n=1 Tax=Labilibaculum sp. K2S TaxID=3056386 RepID=UPI003FA5FC2F
MKCTKCGNKNYETDEFQVAGGIFSKVFNIQNKKFTTVSCTRYFYLKFIQQVVVNWKIYFISSRIKLVNFHFRIHIYTLLNKL